MECEVFGVYKNLRYRILTIDNETYILDMGKPKWKVLFPLLNWILPHIVYKVNNQELIKKIMNRNPGIESTKSSGEGVIAGLIGVSLANLLRPLANVFNIPSNELINTIIVILITILMLSINFYIIYKLKNNLNHVIDLKKCSKEKLWIRPQSMKHFLYVLFSYILFLVLTIVPLHGFIISGDVLILFAGVVFMFILLMFNVATVIVGETSIKFKRTKKSAI